MFILKTFISQILSLICFICGCQAIKVCDIYIFSVLSKKIDYLFRKEKVTTVTTLFLNQDNKNTDWYIRHPNKYWRKKTGRSLISQIEKPKQTKHFAFIFNSPEKP